MKFLRKHDPSDAPTVQEAIETRDALFDELEGAIKEVDKVHGKILDQYISAEKQRKENGSVRRGKRGRGKP